jgi:hypothetical protein
MQLELSEEGIIDMDFHIDESMVIIGARGNVGAVVNMNTRTVKEFNHNLPHPLVMVQFLR